MVASSISTISASPGTSPSALRGPTRAILPSRSSTNPSSTTSSPSQVSTLPKRIVGGVGRSNIGRIFFSYLQAAGSGMWVSRSRESGGGCAWIRRGPRPRVCRLSTFAPSIVSVGRGVKVESRRRQRRAHAHGRCTTGRFIGTSVDRPLPNESRAAHNAVWLTKLHRARRSTSVPSIIDRFESRSPIDCKRASWQVNSFQDRRSSRRKSPGSSTSVARPSARRCRFSPTAASSRSSRTEVRRYGGSNERTSRKRTGCGRCSKRSRSVG